MNPRNTVFDAKRLIGRKFDDPKIQADMKHWSFQVVNEGGLPKIAVEFKGERKVFAPEEVSSMVLSKMREIAEVYLGGKVITIYAHILLYAYRPEFQALQIHRFWTCTITFQSNGRKNCLVIQNYILYLLTIFTLLNTISYLMEKYSVCI